MTPREPSEAAVTQALQAWYARLLPCKFSRREREAMRETLRAAYAVDATEGREG